jgi:hypothetical protein
VPHQRRTAGLRRCNQNFEEGGLFSC